MMARKCKHLGKPLRPVRIGRHVHGCFECLLHGECIIGYAGNRATQTRLCSSCGDYEAAPYDKPKEVATESKLVLPVNATPLKQRSLVTSNLRSENSQSRSEMIKQAALLLGIASNDYDKFIKQNQLPPRCYEKSCWWLKLFAKHFGEEKSSSLADVVLSKI